MYILNSFISSVIEDIVSAVSRSEVYVIVVEF